jgi:hypothetical protein
MVRRSVFPNVDVAPAHRLAYAGAECLRDGFLRAAKRAARCRAGNFIDIEYSISPSVKTR